MTKPPCRHCDKSPVSRPRGLCWNCFRRPGVRELYPVTSKYARRGVAAAAGYARSKPASVPCPHPRGSGGRLASMAGRAAAGESLFHPLDAREIADDADNRAGHAA